MSSLAETYVSDTRDQLSALVVVFLRGGADGLNIIVPHGDDAYYKARPGIGLKKAETLDLDGFFGLNPRLAPLHRFWKDGSLGLIHCVGSEDETRSHFEAQDFMEHGGLAAGGWLGRFLRLRPETAHSALTAVAIGTKLPECLRGAPSCAALRSLDEFGLGRRATPDFTRELGALYSGHGGPLGQAGGSALDALGRIESLTNSPYAPSHGAVYQSDEFSHGLWSVARLIKARVGVQAATVDVDGWDSHIATDSVMSGPLDRLGHGLAAFATDLGPAELARTTIVVMSEFGRRVAENSAAGTDHGSGGIMFVLGGGIVGGKVHADWPGLAPEHLTGPGDLPVRHNYRDVLAPLLARQAPGLALEKVFPGHRFSPLDLSY